jgi:hypothetical protein
MHVRHIASTLIAIALSLGAAPAALAQGQSSTVQFAKGASSASLKGSIKGDAFRDYKLRAGAGQTMKVSLSASRPSTYFNVLAPGSKDEAIYNSSIDGNTWSGQLQQAGEYTIRVYLYRNEARRGTTSNYTLDVGIAGAPASLDAKVSGTPFNATGQLPCTMGTEAAKMCAFGVIRTGPGNAEVRITPPGGMERTLKFSGNQVTAPASKSVKSSKQGDEWSIDVNDFERYRIPDAVINGG